LDMGRQRAPLVRPEAVAAMTTAERDQLLERHREARAAGYLGNAPLEHSHDEAAGPGPSETADARAAAAGMLLADFEGPDGRIEGER
jgi:hypothetical protein